MDIDIEKIKNYAVVELHGALIGTVHSQKFKQAMEELLETNLNKIILNMQQVDFIDSTIIGVFIIIFKKVQKLNGSLFVVNCNSSVKNVLCLTKLDKVLQVCDSIEEAESLLIN